MTNETTTIVVAGATPDLGGRIARELSKRGARLRALVPSESRREHVDALPRNGARTVEVDYDDARSLTEACAGAACVVSALNGLGDVIVDAQTAS